MSNKFKKTSKTILIGGYIISLIAIAACSNMKTIAQEPTIQFTKIPTNQSDNLYGNVDISIIKDEQTNVEYIVVGNRRLIGNKLLIEGPFSITPRITKEQKVAIDKLCENILNETNK